MATLSITVKHVDPLGGGRFKIKIAENHLRDLSNINYNGLSFCVIKALGRGRFIVREVSSRVEKKFAKYIG